MSQVLNTIRAKYLSLPKAARAAAVFTACSVLQKGVAFLITPVYTRIMPQEAYGQYSVFLAWYQLLMIFTTLNMWNYLMNNGMVKYGDDKNNFIAALQGLSTALTLAWVLIYLPFAGAWERATGLTKGMMALMFLELLLMPSFEYYCAAKRFDYEVRGVAVLSLFVTVITPLISIPLILWADDKGMAAIAGKVLGSALVFAGVCVHLLRASRKVFNKEYWVYALKFNLPLIPHFLSVMILAQSDRIMIERMCGQADAAMYSVAYQMGMALQVANAGILSAFVPYTYKALKAGECSKIGGKATVLLAGIGTVNSAAVLVAPEAMALLAPPSYHAAVYVIQPVAMSNMLMFLFNLFANIEYYWGKTRYVAIASLVSALANIALNYAFIGKYGFIAAGYTTLICYALFSLCHYLFMRKVVRQFMANESVYDIRALLAVCSGFVLATSLMVFLYDYAIARYVLLAGASIALIALRKQVLSTVRSALGR